MERYEQLANRVERDHGYRKVPVDLRRINACAAARRGSEPIRTSKLWICNQSNHLIVERLLLRGEGWIAVELIQRVEVLTAIAGCRKIEYEVATEGAERKI